MGQTAPTANKDLSSGGNGNGNENRNGSGNGSGSASKRDEPLDSAECTTCVSTETYTEPIGDGGGTAESTAFKCVAYMDSGCPVTRRELGRATWAFLHTT